MMTYKTMVLLIAVLSYNLILLVGTVYLVGWKGWSAWWFVLTVVLFCRLHYKDDK